MMMMMMAKKRLAGRQALPPAVKLKPKQTLLQGLLQALWFARDRLWSQSSQDFYIARAFRFLLSFSVCTSAVASIPIVGSLYFFYFFYFTLSFVRVHAATHRVWPSAVDSHNAPPPPPPPPTSRLDCFLFIRAWFFHGPPSSLQNRYWKNYQIWK